MPAAVCPSAPTGHVRCERRSVSRQSVLVRRWAREQDSDGCPVDCSGRETRGGGHRGSAGHVLWQWNSFSLVMSIQKLGWRYMFYVWAEPSLLGLSF